MANDEHVAMLKKGVAAWNAWRGENPNIRPDLSGAILSGANLIGAILWWAMLVETNLTGANLSEADLKEARLERAVLSGATLTGANLSEANLREARLDRANLTEAQLGETNLRRARLDRTNLTKANLSGANLSGANLTGANLTEARLDQAYLWGATLVNTDLKGADLTGCRIHGVSAWRLKLEKTKQQNLVITKQDEPTVTVDNIEVAQFIYLLLHNEKIRDVIDTISFSRSADRGAGGQDCQARRGEVQRTPGAAGQPTSRRESLDHKGRTLVSDRAATARPRSAQRSARRSDPNESRACCNSARRDG